MSGFILYVELVTCLTSMAASLAISSSGWSFTKGITGSIRTDTGIPSFTRASIALSRASGDGAYGSKRLAISASSVVIVKATVDGTLLSRSMSRITRLDFVMICIRQLLSAKISRHLRVNPNVASIRGYGSELLATETVSPFNFAASHCNRLSKLLFGLHLANWGM